MKKVIFSIIVIIKAIAIYFEIGVLLTILAYLIMNGYFMFEDISSPQFLQAREKNEIDFSQIVEKEWDIGILLTNKNEYDIVQKYKDKGIINKNFDYVPMSSDMYQLCIILFIKDGVEVTRMRYDKIYNEIKCKNEEYFYNTESTFKVQKKLHKYIIEQE